MLPLDCSHSCRDARVGRSRLHLARCPAAASSSDSSSTAASANGPKVSAAKFCPALLANVKSYVKVPLGVVQAQDETNDDLHTGEDGYVSCTYGHDPDGYRLTIVMHAGDVSKTRISRNAIGNRLPEKCATPRSTSTIDVRRLTLARRRHPARRLGRRDHGMDL